MKSILMLIRKDYLLDFRQKYPILGIVLYIASTIFITYLSFTQSITTVTWNALLWIILLFTTVTVSARSFISEENRSLYYYFLCTSEVVLMAKLLYQLGYQVILLVLTMLLFVLFLGNPVGYNSMFFINLLLGSVGLSACFTMISAISSRANNQSMLMAILGFPVVIPILMLSVTNSKKIALGAGYADIQGNFFSLISVIVIIIAVSFVLFPYSRRN